ncbi:MAG: hypothetical protein AAGH15_10650, partial [Myxococcota bacterium]
VDTDDDGFADAFVAPTPDSALCWRLEVRPNRSVPSTLVPQGLRADLELVVDGEVRASTPFVAIIPPGW